MRSATILLPGRDGEKGLDVFGPAVQRRLEIGEWHATREEPVGDARPSLLRLLEVLDTRLEVPAIGVDRPKRHPVTKDHLQIDDVGRDLHIAIPRRHAGEADDAIRSDLRDRLKGDRAVARAFEDEVDLTELRSEERRVGKECRSRWV